MSFLTPPYSYTYTNAAALLCPPTTPSAACPKQPSSRHFIPPTSQSFTLSPGYVCQKDERALLVFSLLSVLSLFPIHPEFHFKLHTDNHSRARELQSPGFEPRSVHVRFAVNTAGLWRESPRVPQLAPVSIIPAQLRMCYVTRHRHRVNLTI